MVVLISEVEPFCDYTCSSTIASVTGCPTPVSFCDYTCSSTIASVTGCPTPVSLIR